MGMVANLVECSKRNMESMGSGVQLHGRSVMCCNSGIWKEFIIRCSCIHLFIQTISIAPLQVHFYPEALPTQRGYCAEAPQATVS